VRHTARERGVTFAVDDVKSATDPLPEFRPHEALKRLLGGELRPPLSRRRDHPMPARCSRSIAWSILLTIGAPAVLRAAEPDVDLAGVRPDSAVKVDRVGDAVRLSWQPGLEREAGTAEVVLELRADRPLIRTMGLVSRGQAAATPILEGADPVTFLVVGTREAPTGRPPEMSVFNVFFDSPAKRPFQTFQAALARTRVRATSERRRATVAVGPLTAGPFAGELRLTVYDGSRLLHVESVIRTREDRRAILYDTGLALRDPGGLRFSWVDTEGRDRRDEADPLGSDRAIPVAHRLLVAEGGRGAIACFPPPHQFFSPRDLTDNLGTVWYGKGHRGLDDRFGFGIRQSETGGGSFVPWFNAPPGTEQRLGVFYLLAPRDSAARETLRYTHGDRFPDLPGYRTFTTHWHMAAAVAALAEKDRGGPRSTPDLVSMFKKMGVNIVHLAEFHGDGHPQDPGSVRLREMQAMFDECRRLSDDELLVLPGEEANVYLGLPAPGRHPGHWVYLFPRPVYWTMKRASGQPFAEEIAGYGRAYHVGDRGDMLRLLTEEGALAWTAHPRIKASSWTPDIFRNEDFYISDRWLGAAWKAMPADLSQDRLGRRALDLLDDMANWGRKKYMPGEVDVFKIDHTHELYGHMNINYVRLDGDRLPRFDDGWQPILDSLRGGRFFVTTGEVLIPEFTVDGRPSGSTVVLKPGAKPEIQLRLSWTFPMRFVEVISGDGLKVYRERIDLSDTGSFENRTLRLRPDLAGRKWVRVEAWDVATNGAFTQPVWLSPSGSGGSPTP
jgi:hypothetical protein